MSIQNVTFTVLDAAIGGNPVEGIHVELRRSHDNSLVTTFDTDEDGEGVVPELPSGGYFLVGSRSRFVFPRQEVTVVVDSAPVSGLGVPQLFDLLAVPVAVTLPAATPVCHVYGFVNVEDLSRSPSSPVLAITVANQESVSPGIGGTGYCTLNLETISVPKLVTVRGGIWEVDLRQGSIVRLTIPALGVDKRFIVPRQSTANVADILTMLGSDDLVHST